MAELMYGIRQLDNKVVSVEDVPSGISCNCLCPECGSKLIARKGQKNEHHFAHANNSNCNINHINQTLLHKFAKQIIHEEKMMMFPELKVSRKELMLEKLSLFVDSRLSREFIYKHNQRIDFDIVEIEKRYDDFVPDVIGVANEQKYFIEIKVCHSVDELKKKKVEKCGIPMLEIDLSLFKDKPFSKKELIDTIINQPEYKIWIYHPEYVKAIEKATNVCNFLIDKFKAEEKKEIEVREREKAIRESNKIATRQKEKQAKEKLKSLLLLENYKQLLVKVRNDQQFKERYKETPRDFRFCSNDKIPFFVGIPISGEMVFQCDRRIWQGIIFNRWIYNRKDDNAVAFASRFFGELVDRYKIPINKDLCDDYMYFDNGVGESVSLKKSVINQYVFWLEYLGFIKNDNGKITVLKRKSVEPPNKLRADWLKEALSIVDDYSPNIDRNLYNNVRELERQYESERQYEINKKIREEERIRREKEDKEIFEQGKLEVQNLDFSQDKPIIDSFGKRWFLCVKCNKKCREKEMASYIRNKGECQKCIQKR